ncbi:ribonuclease HII [Aquimonas voraii]|uniref:Ribonuclease HII n=1 Tax=Aquimonas voraii TaxID=265719 RepID=A0A1G6S533_9GAMM|nr:ribonuclease HII [Aquimonas voraii]SDD11801.1 RNase HII [Aquimonas voraii]
MRTEPVGDPPCSARTPGIAGVDEAGRGPLAGPLVVAAVVLDPMRPIDGLGDSKRLSEKRREALFDQIIERSMAWQIVHIEPAEIDALNIYRATLEGMRRAVCGLPIPPVLARIDGNAIPPGLPCPAEAWVKGDARDPAIGAASILAKVSRDRAMLTLAERFPEYGFAAHKGYPVPGHFEALRAFGPCPAHRRSFAPVREAAATQPAQGRLLAD